MNTTEVSKKTGNNNEENMSEDKSQNSKEFKNELTDQEVNQIIDNIASGSCGDQMTNIEKNDNGESKTGQSIIISIPADNVHTTMEVPSPNDECESQDEDILLRWDDDEDEQASQEKIDEDILYDLDSVDNITNNDVKNVCVLLDDSNDPNTDASKDQEYKVNNDVGTDTPIENTEVNKDPVIAEDDDSDDVVINDSNDPMIILSDDESIAPDKNAFHQVSVEKLPKDDEQNYDKTVVKEEIKCALSDVDNGSKENDEGKSSMKIENTFEENTNDNIDFLKQQLKVLSESINPNLSSNSIDVSNILGTEFGTTSANVIGALDGFGEPVSNDDSKCSFEVDIKPRVGVDVDIFPDDTDQNIVQTISLEVQNDTNTDKEHVMTGIKMEFEISSVNVQDSLFVKEEKTVNCSDDLEGSVKDVVIESVKTEVDDMSEATNIESHKTELETAKEDPEKDIQTKPSEDMEVVSSVVTNIGTGESITEDPQYDMEKEPSEVEITDIAEEMNVEKTDVIDQDANCVEIEKSNEEIKVGDSEATNTENIDIITEKPLTDIETTDLEVSKDVSAFEAINIETDNKPEETLKESETKPSDEDIKESSDTIGAETTIATESDNDDDKTVSTEEMVVDNSESPAEADSKTSECDNYVDLRSQSPISLDNESMHTENAVESIDPKTTTKNDPENKDPLNYYKVKTDNILRPDVMIEIPTQNLIDVDTDDYLDMDSEETSQDGDTKVEETKEKENIENKDEQTAQKDASKDNQTEKLSNLDVIDVDMDDDSAGEIETKINKDSPNQKIESNEKENDGSKEIPNPETSERTQSNEENIIDLDDYDTELTEKDSNLTDTENKEAKLDVDEASTSVRRMSPDAIDEVPDATDSLGLLAESSRVRRDEDMEEEFYEDDDFEYDESSNQMTAEHSEDSNPQNSESDSKDQEDKSQESRPFHFTACEVVGGADNEGAEAAKDESSVDVNNAIEVNKVADNTELEKLNDQDASICDMETFKLSDASDNEGEPTEEKGDEKTKEKSPEKTLKSPSKTKKLEIANPRHVLNIVDLEESSSEEDVQEEQTDTPQEEPEDVDVQEKEPELPSDVTSVNIPTEIEIMSNSCGNTSEIVTKEGEVVISGVPKPPPHKPARLNTSEVTIKTASPAKESTLIIPETKMAESKPKVGLEIFNLDSDDEDIGSVNKESAARAPLSALELDAALRAGRCVRRGCGAGARGGAALALYCDHCAALHLRRTQELVEGIKNMTPLLELNMDKLDQDLVEISDSESEEEPDDPKDRIGEDGAKILEENLADILNSMWRKYDMDASLLDAKVLLDAEMERLENETKEIHKLLNECQAGTDKLRGDLYATFEPQRQQLPAIHIYDNADIMTVENENVSSDQTSVPETRQAKRRLSASNIQPAKRPAIPLGYAPLDNEANQIGQQEHTTVLRVGENNKFDDDAEVSVVQLSAEAAPRELPAPGEVARAPLRPGMPVFAMANNGHWYKARIVDQVRFLGLQPQFPSYRVRFEKRMKNPCKIVSARHLAYSEPADVRLTIGTRVIALFKETTNTNKKNTYSSGIIAEIPNPVNDYRYLVFFDDGYAQYAAHALTRVVCAAAAPVWDEVHPFSREFVRTYLCAYPERPMVRLHAGQTLNTEWNGKWWESRVIQVDASLVQVYFEEDKRTEWIYRGSTRLEPLFLELQAAVKPRGRHVPRTKAMGSINMPYVEYTRSYEQDKSFDAQQEELRLQRAVAKKSTALAAPGAQEQQDPYISRVVYYTPRNAVRPYKMTTHTCGPKCKRTDVLSLQELRSYNPLAKPLLSGWERQLVRNKGVSCVLYRAPCGRRLRSARELHRYLRATRSDLPVDLFDFSPDTHCLAEYVLAKFIVGKKDLSHGKENVPVPCVNMVDSTLPEFCSYNTERTPTAGVPLNLDPDFLCGCDCTDDCEDKTKCACWKLTLEGAKTIGMEGPNIGYDYKRLPEPLPSGIYECNVRCKCKHTCLNRVAQHPLQLKLQVFKTPNRGWGIRALNDVPKGAFLCVYAGNLLTDATANLDGLNEGDEYLAELDYIEVVEQMKEGYEDDVPEADKILDQKEAEVKEEKSEEEESSSSEEEEAVSKNEEQDDDFRPGYIGLGVMEFNKRLRKRGKGKKEEKDEQKEEQEKGKESNAEDDCITISDDEEVREPSRFTAQTEMGANEHVPKYRSVRSYFGKDEACYIMDAKVQGNIGRYLNHSCSPNVFVQNVFVDTHDPRFPWVAFFALSHIRAGTELTWNYNYDVGSVPGKVLYCYCGAPNCRRRLL